MSGLRRAVAVALCSLTLAPPAHGGDLTLDQDQLRRLQRGSVVVLHAAGQREPSTTTVAEFALPPERLWPFLLELESQLASSAATLRVERYRDELEGSLRSIGLRLQLSAAGELMTLHLLHVHDPTQGLLRWSLDPSYENPVERYDGELRVVEGSAGRSRVILSVRVVPGEHAPNLLRGLLQRSGPRQRLSSLRQGLGVD
jgi:hypothetical protein